MPLYKTITVSPATTVYIWKVEEEEHLLEENIVLTDNSQKRIDSMKSAIHRRAFLSIRHLLLKAGYQDQDVYYDTFGKPHLKDKTHISITHSNEFTGIVVSTNTEVGIDIEKQRNKILRIAHKFTPIEEYRTLANTDALIQKLTIVWGAKEALYKIYGKKGLRFLEHIYISDFELASGQMDGAIDYQGTQSKYRIAFFEFEGFTCVYALKNQSNS